MIMMSPGASLGNLAVRREVVHLKILRFTNQRNSAAAIPLPDQKQQGHDRQGD